VITDIGLHVIIIDYLQPVISFLDVRSMIKPLYMICHYLSQLFHIFISYGLLEQVF